MDISTLAPWPGIAGRVALETGASRSIGAAIAEALGRQGTIVIGTATSEQGARAIDAKFSQLGLKGRGAETPRRERGLVEALLADIGAREAAPAILGNNAGITRETLLLRMKTEEWDVVLSTNLSSIFRLCKGCLRGMAKARYGRIVNIGSIVGLSGNPGQTNYAAAKAGLIGFTEGTGGRNRVAKRHSQRRCAGLDRHGHDTRARREAGSGATRAHSARASRSVADVAAAVVFHVSDAGSDITGETLNVNGGMLMH